MVDAPTPLSRQATEASATSFTTGLGAPWYIEGWSSQDIVRYIDGEIHDTRELFTNPLAYNTPVQRSLLSRPPTSLTFKDMAFTLNLPDGTSQTILEPCSGHFEAGQLVAIMGPSGCGKSTLLDMLAMKKTAKYDGEVLINGHIRDSLFSRVASYVGQEDTMPAHWKVREAIEFNHRLKNHRPRAIPSEIGHQIVDLALEAFGLSGVANTYVGGSSVRGISGGQRRRVSLARGCTSHPCVLFCDEPTSGLSATDAELCIKSLRIIAKKFGVLILVVIHQPRAEVAELFDELVLLTSNPGRMVYSGPMSKAVPYWEECGYPVPPQANPTDVYMDLVTPGAPLDASEAFVTFFRDNQRPALDRLVDEKSSLQGLSVRQMISAWHDAQEDAQMNPRQVRLRVHVVPFHQQLRVLLRRKIAITLRNPVAIGLPIAVPVFQALLMGCMFQGIGHKSLQQQLPFVFILLTVLCMTGMQQMPSLIAERDIMKYETSETLYSEAAFITSSFLVDIPLALIGAISNVLIMYCFSGISWDFFGVIIMWAILLFFVFDSLFGFISAFAANGQQAQVAAIPFNSIFMMFSGFMISKASAPSFLRWIFEISPNGYAMQAIVIKMAKDFGREGQAVLDTYGFQENQESKGVIVMLSMICFLRILQVMALKYRNGIQK